MENPRQLRGPQRSQSKRISIVAMMALAIFLMLMDLKDLFYKIAMCGPNPSWSFTADIHEEFTGIDLSQVLRENGNVRTTSHNQWNALAQQCDSLQLYKLVGKVAHLSARGTGCVLGGVKRSEPLVFVGSMRIDALLWGASLLAETIHSPLPVRPYHVSSYSLVYDVPESSYREQLLELLEPGDMAGINDTAMHIFDAFGSRLDLWEDTLCYEILPEPPEGQSSSTKLVPSEYGCIWSDPEGKNLHEFFTDNAGAKYLRYLSEWVGWNWHTVDYIYLSSIYLRATLRMVSTYTIDNAGSKMVHHWIRTDLGVDGVLYFVMLAIEFAMFIISTTDAVVVAALVVRPLMLANKRDYAYSSTQTARESTTDSVPENAPAESSKKNETLSRILLYADLSSISFRKTTLAVLMVIDAFFSWIYIVPNSTVFAWSTNGFQLISAYLANFRVWIVIIVFVDNLWHCTFVLVHEKLAALVTEFTYISSVEVMICSLLGVFVAYDDLLNVCLIKWGQTDRQREMFPTVPGLLSFYNSYSKYSYGDRSKRAIGTMVIYKPLFKILSCSVMFCFVVVVLRLIVTIAVKAWCGTLRSEVSSFWRTYQRNSVEVFMNDPLRAKALVRSQRVMSYRFGRTVFLRPFVYLEQNYYIYRGRFRQRPLIPLFDNSDSVGGASVNTRSYVLDSVIHNPTTNKKQKARADYLDTQIPLC